MSESETDPTNLSLARNITELGEDVRQRKLEGALYSCSNHARDELYKKCVHKNLMQGRKMYIQQKIEERGREFQ